MPGADPLKVPASASRSNLTASRSSLVTIATSAVLKMVGYLSALSSPSVVEACEARPDS
jgi:hypothetical protein